MNLDDNNKKQSGIFGWFINNHVASNILMIFLLVGGLLSIFTMRTETFPSIDPRLITVSVSYPGATPYEVADGITRRIEEELVGIDGVKRISSSAVEGYGITSIELTDFADADDVYNEVETSVNGLINFPPQDAQKPIVSKTKVTPNVITLAIYGDIDDLVLKYWADLIEDELRDLPGVGLTAVRGIRNYEISVEIPKDVLRYYNLTLTDVSNAINNFSKDIPAGVIESKQGDILLRIQEKKFYGKDFANIAIKTLNNGGVLRLKDIAKVHDGLEDKNLISHFNGQKSAFIDVKRSESEDTLKVANQVKSYLKTINLPEGIKLSLQEDETINLTDRISLMSRNAIIGFVLVFLLLLLFLDLKLAFWISMAIPVSFCGGLMIMSALGFSINMITLFALIVVLGVVVDDGIIMGESIFEAQEKLKGDKNAVEKGVLYVIAPVTVGVLTTVGAFAPLAFSTGTLGQIIRVIPPVVISILFVSLLEAYFILPSHLSSNSRWSKGIVANIRNKFAQALSNFTTKSLKPAVRFAVSFRYATLACFIAILIITLGMVKSGVIRFVFFPKIESDKITINIEMPIGTPFEDTKNTILEIEKQSLEVRAEIDKNSKDSVFESISTTVGEISSRGGGPRAGSGGSSASNVGQVRIMLVSSDFRELSAREIEGKIRKRISNLPNIKKLEFRSSLIEQEASIEIELSHPNEELLNEASMELKAEIAKISGAVDVAYSFEEGKSEYVFKLNKEGLAVGLTPSELGNQIRSSFFGIESQRFQREGSEIVVYVRYPKSERENLNVLKDMRIKLASGEEVALSNVADVIEQNGYSRIETANGKRIITITSEVDSGITTPNEVTAIIKDKILPQIMLKYSGLNYSFEGEGKDQAHDLSGLIKNMLIALMIIYILLGAQLRSYIQPLIIMSSIPFAVVGAILGHFVLGYDLTFISIFGVVALMGVVVNDSVVLIDYLNRQVAQGNDIKESAILAVERRFRPILLTTLSTAFGLLPILLEKSLQAKFLIPMVISLARGILFATFIILFLIPSLVLIAEDVKRILKIKNKDYDKR